MSGTAVPKLFSGSVGFSTFCPKTFFYCLNLACCIPVLLYQGVHVADSGSGSGEIDAGIEGNPLHRACGFEAKEWGSVCVTLTFFWDVFHPFRNWALAGISGQQRYYSTPTPKTLPSFNSGPVCMMSQCLLWHTELRWPQGQNKLRLRRWTPFVLALTCSDCMVEQSVRRALR